MTVQHHKTVRATKTVRYSYITSTLQNGTALQNSTSQKTVIPINNINMNNYWLVGHLL